MATNDLFYGIGLVLFKPSPPTQSSRRKYCPVVPSPQMGNKEPFRPPSFQGRLFYQLIQREPPAMSMTHFGILNANVGLLLIRSVSILLPSISMEAKNQ